MANKRSPAGEVNPATFYIRSPKQDARNRPNREVFMHYRRHRGESVVSNIPVTACFFLIA